VPSARRLSQTLGGYGLVVQGRRSKLGSPCCRYGTLLCRARLLASKSCSITALSSTVRAGCPSCFAGGQRTVFGQLSVSSHGRRRTGRPGHAKRAIPLASAMQVWPFKLRLAAFHSASSLAALKPQCGIMQTHSKPEPSIALVTVTLVQPCRLATEVSPSVPQRQVVQQPPNPSFKRTRLRRSA